MPHCIIKQPNGNFAIFSTIVDAFLVLDISPDEIENEAIQDQINFGMNFGAATTTRDEIGAIIGRELENIKAVGVGWDWSPDWNSAVRYLEDRKSRDDEEQLEEIDKLGLPHRMKCQVTSLQAEKHWHTYWRNRCATKDNEIRLLKHSLAKVEK